jgi:hypothetical protein
MAQNKKSFVLYSDVQGLINKLPDDVAGRLFKHIFAYVNDENPISDDILLNIAFEPIKMQLKRDLVKWENTKEARSNAGKASAEAKRLAKQNTTNSTNVDFVQQSSTKLTVNDNVNVNVNVNDTVNVNDNKKRVKAFSPPTLSDVQEYFFENGYTKEAGLKAFNYYAVGNWKDSTGKQVKNWKQKMNAVWFKDEHKIVKNERTFNKNR